MTEFESPLKESTLFFAPPALYGLIERVRARDRRCRALAQGLVLAYSLDAALGARPYAASASSDFVTAVNDMLHKQDVQACPLAPLFHDFLALLLKSDAGAPLTVNSAQHLKVVNVEPLETELLLELHDLCHLRRELYQLCQPALANLDWSAQQARAV
ncbi:hypothetical protein GO986_02810 [Deinococcus sp. HMF7620]|uniref:Uncharacterized protein n=1 Tax=Deinococcus arboris TaxID=2682977 RepID=A0A7C9HW06_9DEIO|nr:hypothetical protein [Deinococcus arboris]MVN85690.1 hypothetical protein [Deinococcus arboris]